MKRGDKVFYTHPGTGAVQDAEVVCVFKDNFSGAEKVNVRLSTGKEVLGLAHCAAPTAGHLHSAPTAEAEKEPA